MAHVEDGEKYYIRKGVHRGKRTAKRQVSRKLVIQQVPQAGEQNPATAEAGADTRQDKQRKRV